MTAPFCHIEGCDREGFFGAVRPCCRPMAPLALSGGPSKLDVPTRLGMLAEDRCYDLPPCSVFYSHESISRAFRNGMLIDDAIDEIEHGGHLVGAFPPLDAVKRDGRIVAITGNRRLFMPDILHIYTM